MVRRLGPNPVEVAVRETLEALEGGERPPETSQVDLKEERDRRDRRTGAIMPGQHRSDAAADQLAGEAACLANSEGGGALVVGWADDGTAIGCDLDADWLRHRIYELTGSRLTVEVRAYDVAGTRTLVILVAEALEPVRYKRRILWRVDHHCVEIDVNTWWEQRNTRMGFDWSATPSGMSASDVRSGALEVARDYLRRSGEPAAAALAGLTDRDLLRRLNATDGADRLTQAGALVFARVDTGPTIDYIRRNTAGGETRKRVRPADVSLLETLAAVEAAFDANNPTAQVTAGLVVASIAEVPPLAFREAVVNAVTHRDWERSPHPTVVEHIGGEVIVTSPGGFVGGVNARNILTHPSRPRYRALAELLAALRIAEREGVGFDRMVRDMLRVGYAPPVITELDGPVVRTVLFGGRPDARWMEFLGDLAPADLVDDVDALLTIDHLVRTPFIDAASAAPLLQRPEIECGEVLRRAEQSWRWRAGPILAPVAGAPADSTPVWRLTDPARGELGERLLYARGAKAQRQAAGLAYAQARDRISSTEYADLVAVSTATATAHLRELAEIGDLVAGRATIGRGFFYVPRPDEPPNR